MRECFFAARLHASGVATSLLVQLTPLTHALARLAGMNPTHVRVLGDVTLTISHGEAHTTYRAEGLWEQMSFGGCPTAGGATKLVP